MGLGCYSYETGLVGSNYNKNTKLTLPLCCSSSGSLNCVGVRLVYRSLRSTATFRNLLPLVSAVGIFSPLIFAHNYNVIIIIRATL